MRRRNAGLLSYARLGLLLLLPLLGLGFWLAYNSASVAAQSVPAAKMPPGFKMSLFASNVPVVRFLTYSPDGDLYAGQLEGDNSAITILPDRNHDGKADKAIRVASDLYSPNNVSFRPAGFGTVFASGATSEVRVYTDTNGLLNFNQSRLLIPNLPDSSDRRHRTKTVGYGPDGMLYVSVGSFGDDPSSADTEAGIYRYNPDGTGGTKIINGLRNTVGFNWDPVGGGMWGDDNGSDDQGENEPHDELNQLFAGADYGWPYCVDKQVHYAGAKAYDCSKTQAPAVLLNPHAGSLGMAFYSGGSFPEKYWGGLFIAERSIQYPDQRGVYFVPFKNGQPSGEQEPFISGVNNHWLSVAVNPYDGSLMVCDNRLGTIYQVKYTGQAPAPTAPAVAPTAVAGKPAPQTASPLLGFSRLFPETNKALNGQFLNYWFWNGGLARFGLPVSAPMTEKLADGKDYLVQYTERARFEYHPENKGGQYEVLLGLLGTDLVAGRTEDAFKPTTAAAGSVFVSETGHNMSGPIYNYWLNNGGVPVFGYPLSEAFQEKSQTDGKTYLVQYFERNRLEYHPENAGTANEILLGLLGVQKYQQTYGALP